MTENDIPRLREMAREEMIRHRKTTNFSPVISFRIVFRSEI